MTRLERNKFRRVLNPSEVSGLVESHVDSKAEELENEMNLHTTTTQKRLLASFINGNGPFVTDGHELGEFSMASIRALRNRNVLEHRGNRRWGLTQEAKEVPGPAE